MDEHSEDFTILKKRIYAMYIIITKAHFTDTECEVTEKDYDSMVAELCLSRLDGVVTEDEFNLLGGYLVRTYQLFKLER